MNSDTAKTLNVLAMIFIFGGVLLLAYGGYVYASEDGEIVEGVSGDVPPEDRNASLPLGAGSASLAAGIALLFIPKQNAARRTVGRVRPPY